MDFELKYYNKTGDIVKIVGEDTEDNYPNNIKEFLVRGVKADIYDFVYKDEYYEGIFFAHDFIHDEEKAKYIMNKYNLSPEEAIYVSDAAMKTAPTFHGAFC